mgnify:CR=1 FL=1
MACGCNNSNTCDNCNNNLFDPSNLLFFFLALCALSGGNCANPFLGNNELLFFFLLLALLFSGNNSLFNNTCGTC